MPVIKSAAKKARQAARHYQANLVVKKNLKEVLDGFRKKPTPSSFSKAVSFLSNAAKKHVIHPNKASRLQGRLSKLLPAAK